MKVFASAIVPLLLLCFSEAAAETFTAGDDFSLSLPSGWVEAPQEALRSIEAAIEEMSRGANKQRYDYGYQLASASTWFEYPYILVQVNRGGRIPEGLLMEHGKIESELRDGIAKTEAWLGEVFTQSAAGESLYDEDEHILWSTISMNAQGVGAIRGLIAIKVTEFGFIQLMGYATEASFAQYSEVYRYAARSLELADEDRYRPNLTDHAPILWGINWGQAAIAGLYGGLFAGLAALIRHFWNQRNRPQA